MDSFSVETRTKIELESNEDPPLHEQNPRTNHVAVSMLSFLARMATAVSEMMKARRCLR
jgi:hypothetical protein